MKKLSIAIKFILLSLLLAGCGNAASESTAAESEEVIELSYAFFAPPNTFPAIQMEEWKKRLEERTDGRVEVNLFPGGSLLDANNMYDGVASGVVDIGLSSTTYDPGRFPLLAISDLPSGYKNATVASQVVSELIEKYEIKSLEQFKIITSFATEPAYIQSQTPITTLDDLRGEQIRASGMLIPVAEVLGASPVGMAQSELPEALQTGIVNGYLSSREVLMDSKFAEMVSYTTDYPLGINTFVAVMNKDTWDSLPSHVQNTINELNREMTLFSGEYLDSHVQESIDWSEKSHGLEMVDLTDQEKEQWDSKLEKLQAEYVEEINEEGLPADQYFNDLTKLVEKYNNESK